MLRQKLLLIRADANAKVGYGHVMRCLALAQAWKARGGDAMFFGRIDDVVGKRILQEGFGLRTDTGRVNAESLAKAHGFDWVVVDGYEFDAEYQQTLRRAGIHTVFVDDNARAKSYCADFVLNQNPYAKESMYPDRSPNTRLLLGTDYALIRSEFRSERIARPVPDIARNVLVTMGGADPSGYSLLVADALRLVNIEGLEVYGFVGKDNPNYDALIAHEAETSGKIRMTGSTDRMALHMAWADVAITAGGGTCLESMFMGLPSACFTLAENQMPKIVHLREIGAVVAMGSPDDWTVYAIARTLENFLTDIKLRTRLRYTGLNLVDGLGADRVVQKLLGDC